METNELKQAIYNYLYEPDWKMVENHLKWLESAENHHIITLKCPEYPPILREIADPPQILFVIGALEVLHRPQVAVVGSRNASPVGLESAYSFAKALSLEGYVVTSGLALGIDGAAHRGAVEVNCPTIAVMGTGVDHIYPHRHQKLASKIVENGAIVSELPLKSPPKPHNFPKRNRIISGLSLGTLVVEATSRSGSLITARLAAEQGREVFAIPGSIHSPQAKGCHRLIGLGAKLVECVGDILEELPSGSSHNFSKEIEYDFAETPQDDRKKPEPKAKKILETIDWAPTPIDTIIQRSGLTNADIYSMLLNLELNGHICSIPGGYIRVKL